RNLRDSIVPSSATQTAPVPGSEAGDKSYAAESEQTWLERMARDQSIDEKKLVAMLNYREKTKQIDKVAPEPETSSKLLRNMLPALRSFALFLAIEAIAWFLLRQYRFAIADFKQIYRMYLRRESLLVAWQMSQTEDAKESGVTLAVIAAMLQEDQEARLLKDESTASVQEIAATDEKNPITGLVQAAIGNWRSK
ncbi:hypothetical protein, partial [Reyranella sp.]|uniref:hypothetical protein n=1 Tax=Reyranella sp. TaxID=1929291 RepID=UPI0025F33536